MSDKLEFKISSALKSIVGKDLITSDYVAIFEIVKNSFDAKATYVQITFEDDSITIADNGKGMSLDDIKNKWLFLAYSAKRDGSEDIEYNLNNDFNIKKHTIIPLDGPGKCPTITTLPDDYIHYCEPRILTVREYARIQSFPDDFEFKGKYTTGGKIRTQEVPRYSQIGNAIPPLFGEQAGVILI